MKQKILLSALLLGALVSTKASADELSYTWVEGDYVDFGSGIDGFGVRGSLKLGGSGLYGFGGYSGIDHEFVGDSWEAGLGYAVGVSQRVNVIGEVAYQQTEVTTVTSIVSPTGELVTSQGRANIDAYRASVGMRYGFAKRFEGLAKLNYRDYDCRECESGDFSATVGLMYRFNETWAANVEAELVDGDDAWLLGIRASF